MTDEKSAPAAGEGAVGFVAAGQAGGLTSVVAGAADAGSAVVMGAVADEEGILAEGAIGIQGSDAVVIARFADMDAAKEAYFGLLQAEIDGRLDIERPGGERRCRGEGRHGQEVPTTRPATASSPGPPRGPSWGSSSRRRSSPAPSGSAPAVLPSASCATSPPATRWRGTSPRS